jgi:hypothetical protein
LAPADRQFVTPTPAAHHSPKMVGICPRLGRGTGRTNPACDDSDGNARWVVWPSDDVHGSVVAQPGSGPGTASSLANSWATKPWDRPNIVRVMSGSGVSPCRSCIEVLLAGAHAGTRPRPEGGVARQHQGTPTINKHYHPPAPDRTESHRRNRSGTTATPTPTIVAACRPPPIPQRSGPPTVSRGSGVRKVRRAEVDVWHDGRL